MKYVALLRGINVGGNNIIPMLKLKASFEKSGFKNVVTYIQSGNVIFESSEKNILKLEKKTEAALSKTFKYISKVVIKSYPQMKKILAEIPRDWKTRTDLRRDVVFLKPHVTSQQALKESQPREGVDFAKTGKGVLYFGALLTKLTRSGLPKIAAKKIYKDMTIRNYNTVQKLLELMEK